MQKCKKLYRGLDMRVLTCYNNAKYPGIAKLVSRLVWDQETVRSSRTTRTKPPLKSWVSEGVSYSLPIAAPHRADLTVMPEGAKRRLTCT